jgi:hypothetical protein
MFDTNYSQLTSEQITKLRGRSQRKDLTNRADDVRLVSGPVGLGTSLLIETKMVRHINELKVALEFARFTSPDIRDAVSNCIKHIAADMEEVEYEDSIATGTAFKELAACISDFENKDADGSTAVAAPNGDEHEVDRETPSDTYDVDEEIEHVIARPSASGDSDEDDDIET